MNLAALLFSDFFRKQIFNYTWGFNFWNFRSFSTTFFLFSTNKLILKCIQQIKRVLRKFENLINKCFFYSTVIYIFRIINLEEKYVFHSLINLYILSDFPLRDFCRVLWFFLRIEVTKWKGFFKIFNKFIRVTEMHQLSKIDLKKTYFYLRKFWNERMGNKRGFLKCSSFYKEYNCYYNIQYNYCKKILMWILKFKLYQFYKIYLKMTFLSQEIVKCKNAEQKRFFSNVYHSMKNIIATTTYNIQGVAIK